MKKIRTHELLKRIAVTVAILFVYLIGRNVLIYGIDSSAYHISDISQENLLNAIIGGDRYQYTLFALGVMPFTTVTILVQMALILMDRDSRMHISKIKIDTAIFIGTLLLTIVLSISRSDNLIFANNRIDVLTLKKIACIELITGGMIVYLIAQINSDYGIGGHTPFILYNLVDTFIRTSGNINTDMFISILPNCVLIIAITILMEARTLKIPVQRVSIHNEYAKNSYIAYKYNPTGVMPVMLSISFFTIFKVIAGYLSFFLKDNEKYNGFMNVYNLNNEIGILIYLGIIFVLSFVLAFIMLSPSEMADQLRRSGDSIVGVYSGKKTERYIIRVLFLLSLFSAIVLSAIMGISLFYSLNGKISSELALLPSTIMIFISNILSLVIEIKEYSQYDSYKFFM